MRALALCTGLLAALSALLAACSPEPDYPAPSPALWEVTGDEGEHGYLFGTIHALPGGVEWRTDILDNAFREADRLVVEINLPAAAPRMNAVFRSLAESDGLLPLEQRLDPQFRERLERVLAAKELHAARFSGMESWAAALTIAQAYQSGSSANGADMYLLENAGGMTIAELEGLEMQLGLFDTLPNEEQIDLLEAVVQELDSADVDKSAEKRMRDWLAGDVDSLAGELDQGLLADPELREVLLVRRNLDWAGKVEQILQSGSRPFVAVGAAHLVGPDGLPALLAERGFAVKRIQ